MLGLSKREWVCLVLYDVVFTVVVSVVAWILFMWVLFAMNVQVHSIIRMMIVLFPVVTIIILIQAARKSNY